MRQMAVLSAQNAWSLGEDEFYIGGDIHYLNIWSWKQTDVLPAGFAYVLLGIIFVDIVAIFVVGNTVCRK